jgi:hypothetical protein
MGLRGTIERQRRPIAFGCAGAIVMSLASCLLLALVAIAPAFGISVPAPPVADATRPDITMMMRETFLNRALIEAMPENVPVKGKMDVQPGNRLVFDGEIAVLVAKVPVVMTLGLGFEQGRLHVTLESLEAAGYDVTELTGLDASALTDQISRELQAQIEAGLGPGSQIMGIATDDRQLIITGRWTQ